MFIYQPTLSTLELKEDKGTDYVLCWKPKGLYTSKRKPLYTAFLHSIKPSGYGIRTQFNNSILAVEQNYATKSVNAYIGDDLGGWSKNPLNNFKIKNCLFGVTNIVKNSDKEK